MQMLLLNHVLVKVDVLTRPLDGSRKESPSRRRPCCGPGTNFVCKLPTGEEALINMRVRKRSGFQLPVAPDRSSTEHVSFTEPDSRSWVICLCKFWSTSFGNPRISPRRSSEKLRGHATAKSKITLRLYSFSLLLPSDSPDPVSKKKKDSPDPIS